MRRRRKIVMVHQIGAGMLLGGVMFMVTALLIGVAGGSAVLITDLVRKGMVFTVLGGATDVIGDFIR